MSNPPTRKRLSWDAENSILITIFRPQKHKSLYIFMNVDTNVNQASPIWLAEDDLYRQKHQNICTLRPKAHHLCNLPIAQEVKSLFHWNQNSDMHVWWSSVLEAGSESYFY